MKRKYYIFVFAILSFIFIPSCLKRNTNISVTGEYAKLIRVVDGDTIVVNYKGKEDRVRLLCVDTEESVHPKKDRNTEFGRKTSE
mgnify:CR=1 FL=1